MNVELSKRNVLIVGAISFILGVIIASRMDWSSLISEQVKCEERGGAWAIVGYSGTAKTRHADYDCLDPRFKK